MENLKPYSDYKDIGLPWLDRIPVHWETRRLKTLLRQRSEKGHPNEPLLAATQTKGVVRKELYENRTVLALKDLHLLKLVRPGDFVISLRSFQGGIEFAREQGIISPAYTILYSVDTNIHGYLANLFKSKPFIENLNLYVTGIRQGQNIDYEKLSRSDIPLPPPEEQIAITRYLDWIDSRIRRLIRARQKQIKLLEEQRQAIIHQAVTGQIDVRTGQPYPAYKDSNVEWLGQVPEHWDVLPIKRAFKSMDYGISASATDDGSIPLLTMGNIKDGQVIVSETGGVDAVDSFYLLQSGDLLFNRTNSAELVGKVGLFKGFDIPVTFASYLVRLRPKPIHKPEYLNLVLNDVKILSSARREAVPSLHQSNLNPTRYGRLKICLPPLVEQKIILSKLALNFSGLDGAIASAHRVIDLLREYRTRLIADVVTGKVDVSQIASQIPEIEPEDESLEAWEEETELDDLDETFESEYDEK